MQESSRLNFATSDWAIFSYGDMKLVFGFAIFGLVLVGFKLIPPFFANYELEDSIKTEAMQSTYSTRTEEDIREAIIKEARNYDIALTPKQVHVLGPADTALAASPSMPSTPFPSISPATRPPSISILHRKTKACFRGRFPGLRETLIKYRQKALTTGYTGVHGGPRDLIRTSLGLRFQLAPADEI